jgi:hypothetical protein
VNQGSTNIAVAQVSKPAVSPISKSAGRRYFERVGLADGTRVWKPAIQQTWKSALPNCPRNIPAETPTIPCPVNLGQPWSTLVNPKNAFENRNVARRSHFH